MAFQDFHKIFRVRNMVCYLDITFHFLRQIEQARDHQVGATRKAQNVQGVVVSRKFWSTKMGRSLEKMDLLSLEPVWVALKAFCLSVDHQGCLEHHLVRVWTIFFRNSCVFLAVKKQVNI